MRKRFHDINITPFVDVVLVLLIIFMITAPVMFHGIELQLPDVKAKEIKSSGRYELIIIPKNGKIIIDGKEITVEEIPERISEKEVYIKAEVNVSYGFVMKVLEKLREAGIENVGLITAPPELK
jgi:biopolymer transport protein TolR